MNFEELLKDYRAEAIAYTLGVSVATIYKWKAGRKPSRMAQDKINALMQDEDKIRREIFGYKL